MQAIHQDNPPDVKPWDSLLVKSAGGGIIAVVLHVYESGNIKVRCPSGHIIIIAPDSVVKNYGYIASEHDKLISLLIKK